METRDLTEAFNEEWLLAMAEAVLRDDEDATELANTGQVLVGESPGRGGTVGEAVCS